MCSPSRFRGPRCVLLLVAVSFLPFGMLPAAEAQGAAAQAPVARLSHVAGSVQVQIEDATEAPADAALNMPVVQGERILAGENGEAEVEFPDGSVLRITANSAAAIDRLNPNSGPTELQLANGLFYLELRSADGAGYTVYAADESLAPQQNASFRVRVTDGQVEAGVLSGAVAVTRQNAYTADLQAGESLRSDPRNPRRYLLSDTIPGESWDSWNERLSQAALDEEASRTPVREAYAGDQGYGWADLDANGSWYDVSGEGEVWQPAGLAANFDPYGYGNWVYGPGGYTWASGYTWGWLPYRCGSWSFYNGFGWGWIPASGCRNFGYGGGYGNGSGNGYVPVRHPPGGWYPPRRPIEDPGVGLRIHRHPTLPVRLRPQDEIAGTGAGTGARKSDGPVKIAGVVAMPIRRVGRTLTPQGGSAVGSTLLRDFPVRPGTREPVLGRMASGSAVMPGRPAEWHAVTPVGVAGEGFAGSSTGRRQGAGSGAAGYGGTAGDRRIPTAGSGRVPRPTDPPVNANGQPPVGANGPAPINANGTAPVNANGTVPVGANGLAPVGATGAPVAVDRYGFRVGGRVAPGTTDGGGRGFDRGVGLRVPSALAPGGSGIRATPMGPFAPTGPRVVAPTSVAPMSAPAPRMVAPAQPGVRVAPAPAPAPVVHTVPAPAAAPAAPAVGTTHPK